VQLGGHGVQQNRRLLRSSHPRLRDSDGGGNAQGRNGGAAKTPVRAATGIDWQGTENIG
jgi:hypothetical protein